MIFQDIINYIKLPFRKEKELYSSLAQITGFYPRNIQYYKQALMHKSIGRKEKGRPVNNERLEFLGDAVLDAVVGHIVYSHFPGKREGFLTNTRSKLVSRETLGRLAKEMGVLDLVLSNGRNSSHNSYMGGNAFEALVGAIYLDRGFDACMRFMEKKILKEVINIDKVAYKEVNFKSKLIEWGQKNRVKLEFGLMSSRERSIETSSCSPCLGDPSKASLLREDLPTLDSPPKLGVLEGVSDFEGSSSSGTLTGSSSIFVRSVLAAKIASMNCGSLRRRWSVSLEAICCASFLE